MHRFAGLLLAVTLGWAQCAVADPVADLGDRMSSFYLKPSAAAFTAFQNDASALQGDLEKRGPELGTLISVMIARIAQQNHWPLAQSAFRSRAQEIIDGKSPLARYVQDDTRVDPGKLDIWWISFFSTADEKYLDNILQYAGAELPKGDIARMMVIQAATWSFQANCRQHKAVLAFAKKKLAAKGVPAAQAAFLAQAIARAEAA